MRGKATLKSRIIPSVAVAALCAVASSSATAQQQTAPALPSQSSLSLPRPDFHFKGQVGRTVDDSDPATFPQIVRPPKGAPNILLILLDDVGFGQFSVFGRRAVAQHGETCCAGPAVQPLSHNRAVLADAGCLALRPQSPRDREWQHYRSRDGI